MKVIDFARARIAWITHDGSHGVWRVAAAARREDGSEAWFLAPPVMAGDVYGHDRLPMEPAYSYQFIASRDRHVMVREPAGTATLQDTVAPHAASFSDVAITVDEIDVEAVQLEAITAKARWQLTARITATGANGRRWLLDFPVQHLNLRDKPAAFQVETGPVIVPVDLIDIPGAAKPSGLQLAYVFFGRVDRMELLGFGPGPHGRGYRHFTRLEGVKIEVGAA
jgi:hypothetical protein